ncbi:MAG: S8 family serine peptidase [Candidatus Thermoplasmatota archaeon]|nr:S8 family serine peptidase [Candidatus Thermoplasmatota archaeon]
MRRTLAVVVLALLMGPVTGSLYVQSEPIDWETVDSEGLQWRPVGYGFDVPQQAEAAWLNDNTPWWERTALDQNRNAIHDSLETHVGSTGIGLSYGVAVDEAHLAELEAMNLSVVDVIESVDAVLLGQVDASLVFQLAALEDVVMVERYGNIVLYGDIQTPAVKARNSSFYPMGAWDLGFTGRDVNIAMVDTGVDNEHPGLNQKFIAGYDAVCYLHSDPTCTAGGVRETDGTYDPDDGHQHGTACMGMAAATGIDASGAQTDFYGSAPDADLVDVRIGTDAGAGPFENYLLAQEFYESAMNGLQWIIDNRDTAWQGADEASYGIDIISLSWGITSHEGGGSDGEDMHSRILNEAMELGVVVSVAAGNDGPDNDGLSGMGSSSLSITVGATDDQNTVDRSDDTVAGYSSRGQRRDNGDGNPLNELKPEVSAPGSNIVQAEGCVTSSGCVNLLGGSAEDNGYTGRGSGTSYATPSVSGILAMMIEANPDLTTAEMKEILKLTAERRGEASAPDVDPFWNRDFGWGMVDAYEAVKMAMYLAEENLTGSVDVSTQVHILNSSVNATTGLHEIRGLAWGQAGSVSKVEFRINDGEWMEAAYETVEGGLGALERFEWVVALDPAVLAAGNQTVEVRGLNDQGAPSLSVFSTVLGTGESGESAGGFDTNLFTLSAFLVLLILIGLLVQGAKIDPPSTLRSLMPTEPVEAVLLDDPTSAEKEKKAGTKPPKS